MIGRVHSCCVAYLYGLWRVAPLASAAVVGSPPLTPTGGGRYSNDSKWGRLPPRLCLAPVSCSSSSLERSPRSVLGDASTVYPLFTK